MICVAYVIQNFRITLYLIHRIGIFKGKSVLYISARFRSIRSHENALNVHKFVWNAFTDGEIAPKRKDVLELSTYLYDELVLPPYMARY
jgi:hypothetical protein